MTKGKIPSHTEIFLPIMHDTPYAVYNISLFLSQLFQYLKLMVLGDCTCLPVQVEYLVL